MKNSTPTSWVGMDVSAEQIHVAIFRGAETRPAEEFEVSTDAKGIARLKKKLEKEPFPVKCVYEAGPTGYGLYRDLRKSGLECEVIAPSLIPKKAGERVKTNRLDARRLAKYYRSGDLTAVHVPDQKQEALRDLLRARDDLRRDLQRSRQRLSGCLLRHGHHYMGTAWTQKHWAWIKAIAVQDENLRMVIDEYITTIQQRSEQLQRFDDRIEQLAQEPEYEGKVAAYSVLRGIGKLGALTILAEGGDLRRYGLAGRFMGSTGMVPSERSTGPHQRRGSITKTGNVYLRRILIEAAWQYQRKVHGVTVERRRRGQSEQRVAIARTADHRLHGKFWKLRFRYNKQPSVAAVAVARELAGFVWAIGQTLD